MELSDDPETMQQMLHIHQLIQKRIGYNAMMSSLEPMWYRCLSDSQMAAADALHGALGDDILEGSTYRVYYVLQRLGVHPRPPKSGLRQLFNMSRGNDVAFLWFLMETYYTSENQENHYGSNEQIIMSTIFWLDLYPTLRELDRVLPLPHPSPEARRKAAQAEARRIKKAEREKLRKAQKLLQSKSMPEKSTYSISPYFAKPVNRKFRQQNLLAVPPKRPAMFPVAPPETTNSTLWSRWFGDFDFGDSRCIATAVLQKEIDSILSSLHAAKLNTSHVESMCLHHKKINEMEQSMRLKLEQLKQKQREQLLSIDYHTKERNRRRTLEQLEHMTEHYLAQFHAMAVKTRMVSARKRLCAQSYEPDFLYVGSSDCDSMGDKSQTQKCDGYEDVKPMERGKRLPLTCRDNKKEESNIRCKCEKYKANVSWENESLCHRPSTLMRFLRLGGTEMAESEENSLPSPCQSSRGRDSNKYFENNGYNYRFNYRKLFAPCKSTLQDNDEQMRLKIQFIKALDDDVEYLNAVLDGDISGSKHSLVDRSAKRIFREGTELFQQEYEKLKSEDASKESENRLNFGQKYFDADNIELMKDMLRLGLDRVAQDHRYILPTLPNVHSVPLLIKWICARYGKLYSASERIRNFKAAKLCMNDLMLILRRDIVQRKCNRTNVLTSRISSNRQQKQMKESVKHYWDNFMKYFVLSIMELGRTFHSIMQADQGSKFSSTYYAYMPAHIQDV